MGRHIASLELNKQAKKKIKKKKKCPYSESRCGCVVFVYAWIPNG